MADCVIVFREAFVQFLEIVHVTFFEAQHIVQVLVRIDRVADPADVADIVFVTLVDGHVHVYARGVFGVRNYRVRHDVCVTVTYLVVFLDDRFLILLELLGDEFLGAEEIGDVVVVGLLHRTVDFQVRERLVAGDIDFADLGFLFLIDVYHHLDIAGMVFVVLLKDLDIGVHVTFLGIVFLDDGLGAVCQVWRHLCATTDADLDFQVLFVGTTDAIVFDRRDARALFERDVQPHFIALELSCLNTNVGEQPLFPETTNGFGDRVAGNLYFVAFGETGESDEHEIFVRLRSGNRDVGYLVGPALQRIFDALNRFGLSRPRRIHRQRVRRNSRIDNQRIRLCEHRQSHQKR